MSEDTNQTISRSISERAVRMAFDRRRKGRSTTRTESTDRTRGSTSAEHGRPRAGRPIALRRWSVAELITQALARQDGSSGLTP